MIEKFSKDELKIIADVVEENTCTLQFGILRDIGIKILKKDLVPLKKEMSQAGLIRNKIREPGFTTKQSHEIKELIEEGWSVEEVAQKLNKPISKVRSKVIKLFGAVPIIDLEGEIWKKWDDELLVSNMGRVKNINLNRLVGGKSSDGYKIYGKKRIHIMVAKLFVPNPEHKPFVDHINADRYDARAVNLRWVTQEENMNNERTRKQISETWKKKNKEKEVVSLLKRCYSIIPNKIELIKLIVDNSLDNNVQLN